ncbi:MAG TPA: S8 family serine peptidase [Solirubrobacteraceae bacterium]|nr:S8 family serine peptidase [Solirubrobacteraceae bacterium]
MNTERARRRGLRSIPIAAALIATLAIVPAAGANPLGKARVVAVRPTVLVKLHGHYSRAKADAVAARHGMRVYRELRNSGWVLLTPRRVSSGPITRAAALRSATAALDRDPGVAKTDGTKPGEQISPTNQPADEIWTLTQSFQNPATQSEIAQAPWHWKVANFPAAWDYSHGSAQVPVVVIDSEFFIEHPDLKDKFLPGFNFNPLDTQFGTYRTPDVKATNAQEVFHGTHVAGLVGAATNNVIGASGAGYDTPIVPLKVNFQSPSIVQDVAEALNYAISVHPAAINMSFGGTGFNPSWADALARARAAGIVPVASAANDQQQRPGFTFYPAAFPGVVAVGATTPSDQIAFFSSTGAFVDVSAPGDPILSTWDPRDPQNPNVLYNIDGGTSMASPIVAGLVALIKARRPDLTPDEIEGLIEATAVDKGLAGKDQNYGYGRIDAGRALAAAVAYVRPAPPAPAPIVVDSRARTKVKLNTLSSLRVKRNKLFTVKGKVTPRIAGLTVRVQIRRSGASTYHTIKSTKTKSGGKVSVKVRIGKRGRYALRLGVVTTGTVVGSKSPSISLRVR